MAQTHRTGGSPQLTKSARPARPLAAAARLRVHTALLAGALALLCPAALRAQISISTAVDLALRNNPRVKIAQADVERARAQLAQTHDVYIPSLTAGAGLGEAYGYSPNPPTLFTFNGGSLVYNPAQRFYIRSAHAAVDAAQHSLQDARDSVAEDTAQAFLALQHDTQRSAVVEQQSGFATALVTIVQQRLDAGQASAIDLTQAKLTAANIHLALLHAQDDVAGDRDHLARILGVPSAALVIDDIFPVAPEMNPNAPPEGQPSSPAVQSAYANALARQAQAAGDASYRFRPQINLVVQYNRYATFTNTFGTLTQGNTLITPNEYVFGVQITVPLYDRYREAKARETQADASHATHEAENAKLNSLDAQAHLRHSLPEIEARAEVANLQQQLSQQQLEVLRVQLQSGNPNGQQMTPADEQNARISERDKYLAVVDAAFQLHQTQIQLLRLSGGLNDWLRKAMLQPSTTASPLPIAPTPSTIP